MRLAELRRLNVYVAGRSLVDADAGTAQTLLQIIRALKLPLVIASNRGRLMVLPQAVAKRNGNGGRMIPTEITFRGMSHADWLEADVLERVSRLRTYFDRITGCHVLIELANRHHETGNHYHVRIVLAVPGDEVVVSRDAGLQALELKSENAHPTRQSEARPERKRVKVAVRQAFDVARRRLQDYALKQRGAVKLHQASR